MAMRSTTALCVCADLCYSSTCCLLIVSGTPVFVLCEMKSHGSLSGVLSGFCFSSKMTFPLCSLFLCGSSAVCTVCSSPRPFFLLIRVFSEGTRATGSGRDVGAQGISANAGGVFPASSLHRLQQLPGMPFCCHEP